MSVNFLIARSSVVPKGRAWPSRFWVSKKPQTLSCHTFFYSVFHHEMEALQLSLQTGNRGTNFKQKSPENPPMLVKHLHGFCCQSIEKSFGDTFHRLGVVSWVNNLKSPWFSRNTAFSACWLSAYMVGFLLWLVCLFLFLLKLLSPLLLKHAALVAQLD